MAEIKCPCGLRNHMEEEDCKNTNCNACCPLTRPQTNADRIRAMSDDELAGYLRKKSWLCDSYKVCKECPRYIADCCIPLDEWLKQPADA